MVTEKTWNNTRFWGWHFSTERWKSSLWKLNRDALIWTWEIQPRTTITSQLAASKAMITLGRRPSSVRGLHIPSSFWWQDGLILHQIIRKGLHDTAQSISTSELPGFVCAVRLSKQEVSCILRQSSGSVLQNTKLLLLLLTLTCYLSVF